MRVCVFGSLMILVKLKACSKDGCISKLVGNPLKILPKKKY